MQQTPMLGRLTLSDWIDRWWETTVDLRPSTKARDDSYIRNHVLPAFGGRQLASISPLEVRSWVARLSASGLAPATVHKAHQILSKVLRSAVNAGLIVRSPTNDVLLPRIEREEMRFITPEEIETLAAVIDPRYRALVLFDAYCGLRIGELAGLRRERIDLVNKAVRSSR